MKKRGFLLLATLLVMAAGGFAQNSKQYQKAGEKFMEAKNYDAAIEQYTRAIDVEPNNYVGYLSRAQAFENLKKNDEAMKDLEKGLVLAPKEVKLYIAMGRVYNSLGKYDEALVRLNRAANLDKKEKDIYPVKVATLLQLEKFDQALKSSDTALLLDDNSMNRFSRGEVYVRLTNDVLAKKEFEKAISKDKENPLPRIALVDLLIREGKNADALEQAKKVIELNDKNTAGYSARSRVYIANVDFPNAINDVSKNIVIEPEVPDHYYTRGTYYQRFNQHSNAVNDFTKYISLKKDNPEVYYARARSYEDMQNYDKAIADYVVITELAEFDPTARKRLKEANDRMYEINRESVAPDVTVLNPTPTDDILEVRGDNTKIMITGRITDKSQLTSLKINNDPVPFTTKNGTYEFLAEVAITGLNNVVISATDAYDNSKTINYTLRRTEINPPIISITAPYTSESGQVYLESATSNVAIQGKITDESLINSIYVGSLTASYDRKALNPTFTAILDVSNLNKFTVTAEDIYGNKQEMEYSLNREGAEIAANNPMGKTWVIFIENSSYESFAALDGPKNDVSTIRRALANYQIHNTIHLKDMKKAEMERYFNIELRDLVKANQVKSIMVWYAGHGKFINDVGYWIPVDAKRDDEFTYFNVNQLKASLQAYNNVVHTLVVSDACETGAGFYTAMRSSGEAPTCDNTLVAGAKSAQVFSSAGYELASDNSKFTSTFANTLMNNTNACIPIETIAQKVTEAVFTETGQKPKFGKIPGLEDMNGTFFFIAK